MEPLFFKAENSRLPSGSAATSSLQWSRFFSKRKIAAGRKRKPLSCELQWSRFFSKRKMSETYHIVGLPERGFNGAAFFQSGKSSRLLVSPSPSESASMEPLFFKAENSPTSHQAARFSTPLQWSRFFSKRKILSLAEIPNQPITLQWSRFFSKRKMR